MGQTAEELRRQLDDQRDSLGRDLVAIGDRVSPGRMVERRRTALRQSFGRAREAVMGTADSVPSATGERLGDAAGSVSSAAAAVGDAVTGAPEALRSQAQGNPLAAGLIAFGAGALVGSLVPTTRYEAKAALQAQPTLEAAAAELGEHAQGVAGTVKEHAAEAADRLKDAAQDAADSVKEAATSAADQVKADASGATTQADQADRAFPTASPPVAP
jgi:hypothetical protein